MPFSKNLFQHCRLQRLKIFNVVAYSANDFLALQPTALKSTKWRFSGINHPNFGFFVLVPKSPIHTGLIYVKNLKPNISNLGPFNKQTTLSHVWLLELSTPQCMVLHLEVSGQQQPMLLLLRCLHHRNLSCRWTCLHWRGLCCFWRRLHHSSRMCLDNSSLCFSWTYLQYSGLCCIYTFLHTGA